jgi:xanthine dehydrogenase YagT iron-sulfur-binding subunit
MKDEKNDKPEQFRPGVTRRGFLGTVGVGAVGAALAGNLGAQTTDQALSGDDPPKLTLLVNGRRHTLRVEPRATLQQVLREKLGLIGTKVGCERGECGACTVLIDGIPRYSCMTLALEAEGHEITTVEGLMQGERLGPVQEAFAQEDGFQCGYCTPGQVMAAEGLLRREPNPSDEMIREAMSGNLCRCGAYEHIFKAVRRAAEFRKSGGVR